MKFENLGESALAFGLGLVIAAAVAWIVWPAPSVSGQPVAEQPPVIRALADYQLSATEHLRAVIIPEYGVLGVLCVVYVNSDLKIATMQCPQGEFLQTHTSK